MTTVATMTTLAYANGTSGNQTDSALQRTCDIYNFLVNTVIIGTLCIVGLVGNSIAFIVFCKDNIKTSTSFLFQALSFVDSVLLVLVLPVYCIDPLTSYPGILTVYRTNAQAYVLVYVFPLCMMAQTATIWTTVLVAINRYIAVCKPYQASRLCTVVQAKRQIAVVLVCSVLYNLSYFFEGRVKYVEFEDGGVEYTAEFTAFGKNYIHNVIYHIIMYLLFMLSLPLLILTFLNILLIRALKEIKKRRAEMQSLRQQQDNNVTLVLIIVVLVFSICQVPALINHICWIILPQSQRQCGEFQYFFRSMANMLVITNSAVNFLIYFIFNTRFRQVLIENICKRKYKQGYQKQRNNTMNHNQTTDGTRDTLL